MKLIKEKVPVLALYPDTFSRERIKNLSKINNITCLAIDPYNLANMPGYNGRNVVYGEFHTILQMDLMGMSTPEERKERLNTVKPETCVVAIKNVDYLECGNCGLLMVGDVYALDIYENITTSIINAKQQLSFVPRYLSQNRPGKSHSVSELLAMDITATGRADKALAGVGELVKQMSEEEVGALVERNRNHVSTITKHHLLPYAKTPKIPRSLV